MPTTGHDVIWTLDLIATCGGDAILAGGWGVDALLATQSRAHQDVDLLVDNDLIPMVVTALKSAGFIVVTDWLPVRIELAEDTNDRRVDLHPIFDDGRGGFWQHGLEGTTFQYPADTLTTGTIHNQAVRCLTAHKQTELHQGYDQREQDTSDLALLATLLQTDPSWPRPDSDR